MKRYSLSIGCAVAAMVVSCVFDPDYEIDSCEIRCVDSCPQGFSCQQGFCVAEGRESSCSEPLVLSLDGSDVHFACEALAVEVQAGGGVGEYTWSAAVVGDDELPEGLELVSKGGAATLEAKADALSPEDSWVIEIGVRDELNHDVKKRLDFDVAACTEATIAAPEPVCAGDAVAIQLQADHGFGNYEWLVEASSLPPGLELTGSEISGTIEAADSYPFTVRVVDRERPEDEDAKVLEDEQELELVVRDCIRVSAIAEDQVCVGEEYAATVAVSGGEPPYEIDVKGLPDGVEYDRDLQIIRGRSEQVDEYEIEILAEDDKGQKAEAAHVLALDVNACPEVETDSILACRGVPFEQQLQASPDTAEVSWAKLDGPSWVNVGSDGLVSGEATEAGKKELLLAMSSGQGTRKAVVEMDVHEVDSQPCIQALKSESTLPDACVGQRYDFQLQATGGTGSYKWSRYEQGWPSWLELDHDTGVLTGVVPLDASPGYALTIGLSAGVGDTPVALPRSLRARQSCKFAFVGRDGGSERLFLDDVRNDGGQPASDARELSDGLPDDMDVTQFEFSPDGTRIAYSAVSSDGAAVLVVDPVVDLEPFPRLEFSLEQLRHFAWSPDSDALAVLFDDAQGLAQLALLDTVDGGDTLSELPVVAESYSDVFWVGPEVCYFSRVPCECDSTPGLACHGIDEESKLNDAKLPGPLQENLLAEANEPQYQVRGPHFFFYGRTAEGENYYTFYVFDDGSSTYNYIHGQAIPDPGHRWLAQPGDYYLQSQVEHPTVEIYPVAPGVVTYEDGAVPVSEVDDCHQVAAWAESGRALACEADGSLRIALLDEDGAVIEQGTVADTTDFGTSHAKAFSAGTDWFIYDNGEGELKGVKLADSEWQAQPLLEHPASSSLVASPLPDESFLVHYGRELLWLEPGTGESVVLNSELPLSDPVQCESVFVALGPRDWCGGPFLPKRYAITADGLGVAFVTQQGGVHSADIGALTSGASAVAKPSHPALVNCGDEGCGPSIKFSR